MKKKYAVIFLVYFSFILAIAMAAFVLNVTQPTAESFGVTDANGEHAGCAVVPVNVTNVMNGPVQGIRLNVDYNESVLNLAGISKGDLTAAWPDPQLGEDRHTMIIATPNTGDAISNGSSGSVVLLNFSVIGARGDTSPMNLTLIELSNPDGIVGTAPAENGLFAVITSAMDNNPPVIAITFPRNGSTLSILENSVVGCITDESEFVVAELRLNGELVTSLEKGCFNVKVSYRANETNKIEVFARDKEGNADVSQVLINVLPNIVVLNKTVMADQTLELKEAKNATNTVIELNATKAADISVRINANTDASALGVMPATSAYGLAQDQYSLEKYVDVEMTGIDEADLTFVSLHIYYTTADLDLNGDGNADDSGDLNETTLKIYWFNPNTSLWLPLGPGTAGEGNLDYTAFGGPKVLGGERNEIENYLEVTLNHFSTFALAAEKIPAPVTPTPTPTPLPAGGGGGAFLPTPTPASPLPLAMISTETPTLAPTAAPSSVIAPTDSPVPFPAIRLYVILVAAIAILASVMIVSVLYYTLRERRRKS